MIDWNRVIELRDALDPDDLLPTIDMILAEIQAHLFALDTRTQHLAEDLHLLRGLALNIGFTEFCAQCLRAEQQLAQGSQSSLRSAALRASFGHTKQLFLRDLPHVMNGDHGGRTTAQAS
ncbi:Hpt domain-containing protein [Paracoccus sp. Ld10]|uniref:Hpt domain-containing protein n=1 Tax=Paracoccus sp. Ld10 TaxID=649158 RepID=UPI003865A1F6